MKLKLTDAQCLAQIDHELGDISISPAEYEIVRRVIYATGDFDYASLLRFSGRALSGGAGALASRRPIIVDVPLIQVGIVPFLQNTFANPVYCATEVFLRSQTPKADPQQGIKKLAERFPEAVFIVGKSLGALLALEELISAHEIKPALIIATTVDWLERDQRHQILVDSKLPQITVKGRKGGAEVAIAIIDGLVDLSWQAYRQTISGRD